jgi:outer membrane lipoprotein carrier protein
MALLKYLFCRRPAVIVAGLLVLLVGMAGFRLPAVGAASAPASAPQPTTKNTPTVKSDAETKLLAAIRDYYRKPQLLSGRFTQTTTFADSSETQVASGQIWLQGPDKMRWQYLEPEKQLLVSDGITIWYYTPDLNQVMTGAVKDIREARIIVRLLSEIRPELEGLDLVLARRGEKLVLSLSPKKGAAAPFEKMEMIFAADNLNLSETRMLDLFGNRIVITYHWEGKAGKPWPRARFRFVPPKGCDIMPLGQ